MATEAGRMERIRSFGHSSVVAALTKYTDHLCDLFVLHSGRKMKKKKIICENLMRRVGGGESSHCGSRDSQKRFWHQCRISWWDKQGAGKGFAEVEFHCRRHLQSIHWIRYRLLS